MKKVLLIGNSFTFYHDMPQILEKIANQAGVEMKVGAVTKGGAYLAQYADPDHEYHERLAAAEPFEQWDTVVLQDQSFNPANKPAEFTEAAQRLATLFPDAEKVFYQTWAYREGSQKLASTGMGYEQLYLALKESYRSAAELLGAKCAPVGDGFMLLHRQLDLYEPDDFHPSLCGSYLAACVLFSTLTDRSPLSLPTVKGLEEATATLIRQTAEKIKK